jgi:hypothetical protein
VCARASREASLVVSWRRIRGLGSEEDQISAKLGLSQAMSAFVTPCAAQMTLRVYDCAPKSDVVRTGSKCILQTTFVKPTTPAQTPWRAPFAGNAFSFEPLAISLTPKGSLVRRAWDP